MSTTQSHSTTQSVPSGLKDLFDELIFESGEFCSNCCARIRAPEHFESNRQVQNDRLWHEATDPDTPSVEGATVGTGDDPMDALFRAGDGVLGHDVETIGAHGAKRKYTPRTFCDNCGSPGGTADPRTPSQREVVTNVPAVASRYYAAGIPINEWKLRQYIKHLKSQDRFRGAEREIWRAATAKAVEKARIRDCVRATYGSDL